MDRIRIAGGTRLKGEIKISGAKNSALPLITATLLTDQAVILENVPALADILSMSELLMQFGTEIESDLANNRVQFKTSTATSFVAPYDIVRKMRASILVLGPLVARYGQAKVSLPGGCAIGTRPVDIHLDGLRKLGAIIDLSEGYIIAKAPYGLIGADITMPLVSVTATENLLMAATLAKGQTRLINAAREPEIIDLANCLISMGAKIQGAGTDTIIIEGVTSLKGTTYRVVADRIETGTFAIAAAITGGDLLLRGASLDLIPSFSAQLTRAGATLEQVGPDIHVRAPNGVHGVDIMTEPFPGFATDLQAQMMALMTICQGASMITETIFENRFMHVPELCRMGANITVHGSSALIRGIPQLRGAEVMATDLRASVSLVLAGLAAKGQTIVHRVYHLDRGYERIEEKLNACGASIERLAA